MYNTVIYCISYIIQVREDEVVFFGLLGDLFPGIDPPRKVNPTLEEQVVEACKNLGNHPDELFRLKVVQLEELLEIRHCVFVMGPAGMYISYAYNMHVYVYYTHEMPIFTLIYSTLLITIIILTRRRQDSDLEDPR